MTHSWSVLTAGTALACAASGGAFLTYSGFTTTALSRLPASAGMAAMQQVNLAAPRSPAFMTLVLGPALLAVVLAVRALLHRDEPGAALTLAGAAVYVLGVVVTTAAFHVPRNDALAVLDATTQAGGWHAWLRSWVAGNHVRTLSGLLSAGLLLAASRS